VATHEEKCQEARRERKRVVIEPAFRGTIRDRFLLVLAKNCTEYRVGVSYAPILEVPRKIVGKNGKRFLRKEYIKALSKMIARQLQLDASRVEDTIYSYAALSGSTPVIIKNGLTEEEYYRLNMLAKDWPGLVVERTTKRIYPRGKSCCHVVGYTAPLQREEFDRALCETATLRQYITRVESGEEEASSQEFFSAKERLLQLEHRAYRYQDEIGKTGIEAACERQLRGASGKRLFVTTASGEVIREESGSRDPISGKRVVLTLSSELQEWCETLLEQTEHDRYKAGEKHVEKGGANPRVRGGAIIAIDPHNGEVLACASYPQFDPNDFVRNTQALFDEPTEQKSLEWIKNDGYVRRIWDQEWEWLPETHCTTWMTWNHFITMVIPPQFTLKNQTDVLTLLNLQKELFELSSAFNTTCLAEILKKIPQDRLPTTLQQMVKISQNPADIIVLADLARLLIRHEDLPVSLWNKLNISLEELHTIICAKACFTHALSSAMKKAFTDGPFAEWKKEHETSFIEQCRKKEKELHQSPRPFLSYLDAECKKQYATWWETSGEQLLWNIFSGKVDEVPPWAKNAVANCVATFFSTHQHHKNGAKKLANLLSNFDQEDGIIFLSALQGYEGLSHKLWGKYTTTVQGPGPKDGKGLVRTFLSFEAAPMASFCYMQPSPPGSIFKLVVGYAALHRQLNLLNGDESQLIPSFYRMYDGVTKEGSRVYIGADATGKLIPQSYKGGRIPKSLTTNIGEIDMIHAIAHSSNPYFSLLAAEFLENPEDLNTTASLFGYGKRCGMLPWESPGFLPKDLSTNKTGLYTTAIGQHTLLATPLQTATMLCAIANGGDLLTPRLIKMVVGAELATRRQIFGRTSYPHKNLMRRVGIEFPIWLQDKCGVHHDVYITNKKIRSHLPMTRKEQYILFEGMRAAAEKIIDDPRVSFIHGTELLQALHESRKWMIGKSGTAEVPARLGLGLGQPPYMYNHTSFGAVFFSEDERPDLVVMVFLRYGTKGREAAPLAASVAKKWREIQKKYSQNPAQNFCQ
jgi:cell division protein FtsI/penicillin-binding protein 2